jgi:ATP-binding cassette subfamily B protein
MILGKTGSGKSTIAQLLLRHYDVTKGELLINGNGIKNIPLQTLRENIAYVPQDVFLFSDSISNNISFGLSNKGDVMATERAAKFASIHNEIQSFPEKYDTVVGERGVTLSGGQKQRISIARALMKDAGIVIFDDCLSAVDAKTEHEISRNLDEYLKQRTAIIITHRIISSIDFNKIIVMEDGMISESGTHAELLENKGLYAEIWRLQSSGFDIENMMNS